jgi:N6-L-threonylcarbamoyladenine synthase
MLGLAYPGGPAIDVLAKHGNPAAIKFPRTYLEDGSYDFSFSGIKTAVLYYLRKNRLAGEKIDRQLLVDICASFQVSVVEVLVEKTIAAAKEFGIQDVTIAGGVSANSLLRSMMDEACKERRVRLFYPQLEYCMDNGAMIAYVGWMKLQKGITSSMELPAVANLELL